MKPKHASARNILARNIRLHRHRLGISQEKLAERCGLHRTYIGAVERAERNVSTDNLEKIARALNISLPELLSDRGAGDGRAMPESNKNVQTAGS